MPKLSLIIPVYNTEKYLSECLNSCINQTLHDIEIICIDDCSTDASKIILDEYQKKDARIKIICHKENLKQGTARNTGVRVATGKYIWFIDSDDYIDINACQILYDTAESNNVEILCFNGIVFKDLNGRKFIESGYYTDWPKNINLSLLKAGTKVKGYFSVSPCMYITRKDFLEKFTFRTGCYYEDTDFTPILFASSSCLRCINYTAYYRRITPGSTTQTPLSEKKIHDKIEVVLALQDFIKNYKITHKHFLYQFFIDYLIYVLHEIKSNKDNLTNNDSFDNFIKKANFTIAKRKTRNVFLFPFKIIIKICKIITGEI